MLDASAKIHGDKTGRAVRGEPTVKDEQAPLHQPNERVTCQAIVVTWGKT